MQNPEVFEPEVHLTNQEAKAKLDQLIADLALVKLDTEKLKVDTEEIKADVKTVKDTTVPQAPEGP